jgi:predicted MFS family arabinose efflux permease
LLLYSSVWAILWNIISGFLTKYRWKSFVILNIFLSLLIIFFPFFNSNFFQVWIIAFLVWLVFWASTNLIDSFYLSKLWEQDKKEYGSSTYGLIFSIILFWTMFISSYIDKQYWFDILMYLLGWGVLLGKFLFFNRKLWKK